MPAKRRRCRRRKRSQTNTAVGAAKAGNTSQPPSVGTAQTCCVCHRSDRSVLSRCLSHTLCEVCTKVVGTSGVSSVRCPLCPEESLSSRVGVVINKVKNLWLSATGDKRAESGAQFCSVHAKQTLEFLCTKCDVLICPFCKLSEHECHSTRSLQLVVADGKQRLADARCTRLHELEDRLRTAVKENGNRERKFRQMHKKAAQAIHHRHGQLTDVINKHRDSALRELESMAGEVESCLEEDETRLNNELKNLLDLQRRIDHNMADTDPRSVLSIDREIENEWSIDNIMVRRSAALPSYNYTLKLSETASMSHANFVMCQAVEAATKNKIEKLVDCFIGHPVIKKTHLPKLPLDSKVTPRFRCCEDPAALVLSVCPTGTEKVAVSYTTSSDLEEGVTKSFFQDGRPSKSFDFGLCTLSVEGNGQFWPIYYRTKNVFGVCTRTVVAKSGSKQILVSQDEGFVLASYFRLPSPLCLIYGRGIPRSMLILACDAVAPLNFDVTPSSDVVAVVDLKDDQASPLDNNLKNNSRVVKVISISGDTTFTDVYEPPSPDFVPSDVCFFRLDGCTVLLVSDMATSSIHVIDIHPFSIEKLQFMKCQFKRYLVADYELLKHPTALNTDEEGRLWVACKGGQLLTVELDP